jgi:hypothetical protein
MTLFRLEPGIMKGSVAISVTAKILILIIPVELFRRPRRSRHIDDKVKLQAVLHLESVENNVFYHIIFKIGAEAQDSGMEDPDRGRTRRGKPMNFMAPLGKGVGQHRMIGFGAIIGEAVWVVRKTGAISGVGNTTYFRDLYPPYQHQRFSFITICLLVTIFT